MTGRTAVMLFLELTALAQNASSQDYTPLRHDKRAYTMTFSPDGGTLAVATRAGEIVLWDIVKSGERIAAGISDRLDVPGKKTQVTSLCFSPDSSLLAAGTVNNQMLVWNRNAEAEWERVKLAFPEEYQPGLVVVAFSADGDDVLASRGSMIPYSGFCRWEIRNGRSALFVKAPDVGDVPGIASGFVAAPDGTTLYVSRFDHIALLDPDTFDETDRIPARLGWLEISPDGTMLAAVSPDSTWRPGAIVRVKVWNLESREEVVELAGNFLGIHSVSFSSCSRYLAVASAGGVINVLHLQSPSFSATLRGDKSDTIVEFSPTDGLIAASGSGKTVKLWNLPFVGPQNKVRNDTEDAETE